MSSFLNSLKDRLTAIEQKIENLPRELDAIMTRLDRSKLRSVFLHLSRDLNNLLDARYNRSMLGFPLGIQLTSPYIREITNEDLQRWREAYKSEVRVIIGKERVALIAPPELASKYKMTVSRILLGAQQQGYVVLSWDQYQKLLDEIGKLIAGDKELGRITESSGTIMGIPLPTTAPDKTTKLLT